MTADQTIALASVIASGAVALVAVVGSVTTGFLDRRARRKEARIARRQPRLERTYLELAIYVHRRRMEANAVRPFVKLKDQPAPEPVTAADVERVQALVVSIASDEVRDIIEDFASVESDISNYDAAISADEHAEPQTGDEPRVDYRKRILDAQHKLNDIEDQLHEQIRRELDE